MFYTLIKLAWVFDQSRRAQRPRLYFNDKYDSNNS